MSPIAIRGVLSAIRNRIVDFVLSIEAEQPLASASSDAVEQIAPEAVAQRFQVIIMGSGHAINLGGAGVVQNIEQQVIAGNLPSLKAFLRELGIARDDLDELDAVVAEAKPSDLTTEQSRIRRWIKTATDKASAGGTELVKAAAREVVLLAVRYSSGISPAALAAPRRRVRDGRTTRRPAPRSPPRGPIVPPLGPRVLPRCRPAGDAVRPTRAVPMGRGAEEAGTRAPPRTAPASAGAVCLRRLTPAPNVRYATRRRSLARPVGGSRHRPTDGPAVVG